MKTQDVSVICFFSPDGPEVETLIRTSFEVFLRKELEKVDFYAANHV